MDFQKLPKQPLTMVLAEFCYSSILKMSDYIPDIQERLRKVYPIFKQSKRRDMQLNASSINMNDIDQWLFISPASDSAILIEHNRLVLFTSDYERFPGFSDRCFIAMKALKDIVDPGLIQRIGLRYVDHVVCRSSEEFTQCVDKQFLPNTDLQKLGSNTLQHRVDTAIETSSGTLVIRSLYGKHGLSVMPDVSQELPIKVVNNVIPEVPSLILDFDHAWTESESGIPFELETCKEKLDSLHEISRDAFWEITSEYARNTLWS